MPGTLYLIPTPLSGGTVDQSLPAYNHLVVQSLDVFFVEHPKTARYFLKACGVSPPFDQLTFYTFDKQADIKAEVDQLWPVLQGHDAALISEAGMPGLADPGAELVATCHRQGIPVKPLVGPSSVPMAISASGLNGQAFTFHGYLPVNPKDRQHQLKRLEKTAYETGYTQAFMETPYRNDQLLQTLLKRCQSQTLLCIAANLSTPNESIKTMAIEEWRAVAPSYHKSPAIFALGRP